MSIGLLTGAVIAVLINFFTALVNRKIALKLIPWLVLYLLIVGSYEILTINTIWEMAMEISKKYPKWITYLVVILITGSLGGVYWKYINDALIKVEGKIDKSTLPDSTQVPTMLPKLPTAEEIANEIMKKSLFKSTRKQLTKKSLPM